MTFSVLKVTIKGTLATAETWSINPTFTYGDFPQPDPTFSQLNAAVVAINGITPPTDLTKLLTTAGTITGCRVEARGLDGTLVGVGEGTRATPLVGTTVPFAPPQTSAVLSLRTARAGGRGRGRLYWPTPGITLDAATLRWSSTQQGQYVAAMKTYLSAINDAAETALGFTNGSLVVWSREGLLVTPVNAIQAGNVLDTQRRRRDALPEAYQSVAYP